MGRGNDGQRACLLSNDPSSNPVKVYIEEKIMKMARSTLVGGKEPYRPTW